MKILDIRNGKVEISAEALLVPELSKIYNRDKTKGKDKSLLELAYVYYTCDFQSPYADLPDTERDASVAYDLFKDGKYKPDKDLQAACVKYSKLIDKPSIRLLRAVERKLDEFAKFLDENTLEPETMKAILGVMTNIAPLLASRNAIKDQVEKDIQNKGKVRGQVEIGLYEE